MNKSIIFLVFIGAALLCSATVSAIPIGKPGDFIPLRLSNYEIETSGLPVVSWFTGTWKPAYVKYYLVDPYGTTHYMINSPIDQVTKSGSKWILTDDSGLMKIPAFSSTGMWVIKSKIYDVNRIFIVEWNNKIVFNAYTVQVESDATRSFFAPYYFYINLGGSIITGELEYGFATPDIIVIVVIIVALFFVLINLKAFLSRRKQK
jgi:lipid-A-disaccharide synthase-like uncharacterized protein